MKTIGHGYGWNDLEVGLEFRTLNRTISESDLVGFDTIHLEVKVAAIKPTSRGNCAVVTTVNNIVNQRGETVITNKAVRMMAGRASA